MDNFTENKLYIVIFIIITSAFCTLLLSFCKESLKERIDINKAIEEKKTILNTLKIEYDEKNLNDIENIFNKSVKKNLSGKVIYKLEKKEVESEKFLSDEELKTKFKVDDIKKITSKVTGLIFYKYVTDGKVKSYVFFMKGPGLWGTMKGYLALSKDLKKIVAVRFFEHEETPGLGGRITDIEYIGKFDGLVVKAPDYSGVIIKNQPSKPNEVDSMSGATITSNRLQELINKTLEQIWNKIK